MQTFFFVTNIDRYVMTYYVVKNSSFQPLPFLYLKLTLFQSSCWVENSLINTPTFGSERKMLSISDDSKVFPDFFTLFIVW